MYVPRHFRAPYDEAVREMLAATTFAPVVSAPADGPVASHLPLLYDRANGGLGRFRVHLARANPHWRVLEAGAETLVICLGPHGYISPAWYRERNVPTWDYIAVHAYCEPAIMRDRGQLAELLDELMRIHEVRAGTGMRYADYPAEFLAGQLEAIVGVELTIRRVEASFKLSQNRSAADRVAVCTALRAAGEAVPNALAAAIERFAPGD